MSVRSVAPLLFALILVACSAPAPSDGPGPALPAVTLDLGNRSDGPCDVYRGRALLATVPPGEWVSVPNLAGPRVHLTARCGGTLFEGDIDLETGAPSWVVGAAARPMRPAPARLELINKTAQDYDLSLTTGRLGSLLAGGTRTFGGVTSGTHHLRLVEREGRGAWELTVDAKSGETTSLVVDPPVGSLILRNDSDESVQVRVGEHIRRRLSPGEQQPLTGLSPGSWRVEATLIQSRRTVAAATTVSPGEEVAWSVSRETSAVKVRNLTDEAMKVSIRGVEVGLAEPGMDLDLGDLATGAARLVAQGQTSGIRLEKEEILTSGATHRWELRKGAGLLTLVNMFPEEIQIFIDSVRSLSMAAAGEVSLSLPAGVHVLGWYSELTNSSGQARVEVSSDRGQRLTMGPGSARVSVTNRLDGAVALYLGSRFQARVLPGARVTLCGLMSGSLLLEAVEESGRRRIHRQTLNLEPGARMDWEIQPRTFSLRVENTTGEDLRPVGDLEALLGTLAAGDTTRIAPPVGALRAAFVGKRTGLMYQRDFPGKEGEEQRWSVPPPVGTLVVTNSTRREVLLSEEGREVARVAPGGRGTLTDLAPGAHSVTARAEGLLLGKKDIMVRPGSEFLWDLRPVYGQVRVVNRTDDEVLLFWEGQPTGRLLAGAETTLKDLPTVPVSLRAVHQKSGAARGIRLTPSGESPPTWFIEADAGQLMVSGLAGQAGELRPSTGAAVSFEGNEDRVFLALAPGWHDLRILLEEGGEPDVRRVRIFAGQTTAISLDGDRFSLEVNNGLEGPLLVEMDGRGVATIPGGGQARIDDLMPGMRRFSARPQGGGTEVWLLREVSFQGGRTYRWAVPLEPAAREDLH